MSLIPFHRILIATAIVFCGGFAIWELLAFMEHGGALSILLTLAFALAAAALAYYLYHLPRFLDLPGQERNSSQNPGG